MKLLPLRPGLATSIGSLPHDDADEAAAFVLGLHPDLPAAPQLPGLNPREGMIAQAAAGIRGVTVGLDGRLALDVSALDPQAPVAHRLDGPGLAGLRAFLTRAAGRRAPVKVQLTGPLTLGIALARAGAPDDIAFRLAAVAVRGRTSALVDRCRRDLPQAPVLVFLDEPGLALARSPMVPMASLDITAMLRDTLRAVPPGVITGVHCCGGADWDLARRAGPDIVSLPAVPHAFADGDDGLVAHLERGGWVAWGTVPTDRDLPPEGVGALTEQLWTHLCGLGDAVGAHGVPLGRLWCQSLVTPACGLAGRSVRQAADALRIATAVGDRVADLAVAGATAP